MLAANFTLLGEKFLWDMLLKKKITLQIFWCATCHTFFLNFVKIFGFL